tara:strand:+ start:716 stop:976 length:261 start_codon:yes stop_codon:yes gene_type:complete
MILNIKGPPVDIVGVANSVPYDNGSGSSLVSVINTGSQPAVITCGTGSIHIAAGERVSIAKTFAGTIEGENSGTGPIFATPIGYEH